jgi:hypothetical protein
MRPSALWLMTFFLTAFLSVSSGIIASTDGLFVFKVTQALVEHGEIAISEENILIGYGDQPVSRFGLGLSLAAIPSYLLGRLVSVFTPESFQGLVLKGSVSLTNVVVSALACLLLFLTGRRLGYSDRVSLLLTMSFAFTTFFVVYATKSFLTQPLETLCLVGTLYHLIKYSRTPDTRAALYAGGFCGAGILTKWVFLINLPMVVAYLLATSGKDHRARDLSIFALPVALFLALALGYNYMRFGSIIRTGYEDEGVALFSTPLLVGLYGLLFSAGKSLFLYAPIAVLGCVAVRPFGKSHRREMLLLLALFSANLIVSSKYYAWAGEGSWGPRYLAVVLPCLVLPLGALLEGASRRAKQGVLALSLVGLLVQFGGISIYYGTYYRVIGEYPYQSAPSDPLFMYKTHFVPNYSPVWRHMKMAAQNWGQFLSGEKPTFTIKAGNERIPLSDADLAKLPETLDLWFAYAYYVGAPFSLCLLGMTSMIGATAAMGWRLYRQCEES